MLFHQNKAFPKRPVLQLSSGIRSWAEIPVQRRILFQSNRTDKSFCRNIRDPVIFTVQPVLFALLKPRDNPFAAVDAQTREILQFELLRIWALRPMTMVFVTHSIEEAVLMGDRVVVLKGRPSSVFEIIDVNLPGPRDRSTLGHPRFAEIREHVWSTLMDEARAAEFEVN